jgi:hypothetical protein
MKAIWVGFVFVACALVAGLGMQAASIAEDTSAPPHAARPAAGVPGPDPLYQVGVTEELIGAVNAYNQQIEAGIYEQERQALADMARRSPVRSVNRFVGGGDCTTLAAELGISEDILWRESRCQWVDNPGGCSGRGCLGPAQIDAGHFSVVSPWNPNVPGTCYGLSYAECAQRLPRTAW